MGLSNETLNWWMAKSEQLVKSDFLVRKVWKYVIMSPVEWEQIRIQKLEKGLVSA